MKSKFIFMLIIALFIIYWFINYQPKKEIQRNTKLNEKYYQTKFCNKLNGIIEFRLKDATRVDCLTDDYAIEVDWAKKWAEGIGQSLYYGLMTNRKPAVALIVNKKDKRFIKRLEKVANKFKIKIFFIQKIER